MIRRVLLAAMIIASLGPVSSAATTPVRAIAADAEHGKLAEQLVHLLNSEELVRSQSRRMVNDTLSKAFADSAEFAAMERDAPGVTKAVIEAVRPVLVNGSVVRLPTLWARLVPIYARTFSTVELHSLLDFYGSPAGGRLIAAMSEGVDFSQMMNEMVAKDDSTVTSNGLRAGLFSGAATLVRTASPEDVNALMVFVATDTGKKARLIAPDIQAAYVAWANEDEPELDAQAESTVKRAIEEYLGKSTR